MSGLFNRLKSRKTGPPATPTNNITQDSETTTPACAFDEEGFLCPICHQKFADHTELAQHYTDKHAQEPVIEKDNTNVVQSATNHEDKQANVDNKEAALWKQQFVASEESRMLLTTELMQQKQHTNDLEEELQLLQKHLKSTQTKVAEQSQEIASLKATKDVYDAQLAIFTDELLNTKDELKAKQRQVATLCNDLIPRSTNDDVDVLKRELVTVQQCMNEMALEKEQQIEQLRALLTENYQFVQRLDQVEVLFNQNLSAYDELINTNTSQLENGIREIKQSIRITRERKDRIEKIIKHTHNNRTENQTELKQLKHINTQLQHDLEQQKQSSNKLANDLQIEQRQSNSYRNQINTLGDEIQTLEKTLNDLREEKNHFIQTKIDSDEDNERQNLIRQITQEKDQYEQQTKDLRVQIKQANQQRQQIQEELDDVSKQILQLKSEKDQLQNEQTSDRNEMKSLRKQLDDANTEKERRVNELKQESATLRQRSTNADTHLQIAKESNANQKREIERLKAEITDQPQ